MSGYRILHIIQSLGVGGAEQLLATLLPTLKGRGHDCFVATLWGPHDLEERFDRAEVPVHHLELGHRWNVPRGMWRVSRLVHELKPDIVHSHLFFPTLYTGLSRPFARGTKRIVTFHNLAYSAYPATTSWKKLRREFYGKIVRDGFDGATAVSQQVSDHHHENLGRRIETVIPNAINLEAIERAEATAQSSSARKLNRGGCIEIISPGRLVPEKGHRHLVRALPYLLDEGVSPELAIFGHGPAQTDLQAEIEALGLGGRVHIRRPIKQEKLFDRLLCADLVVFPSTHEGFGIGAAEAMALGRPVIAGRVGGLKEIIEHERTGLLVDPTQPSDIASAIKRIADSPEFASEVGRKAREYTRTRFGPAAVAEQYEQLYETVVGT